MADYYYESNVFGAYKTPDPPYIRYLLAATTKHTVFFIVGNPALGEPEEIGANKLSLLAHSEVFRKMLEESPLAEEGSVEIPNIQPNTFRHMLRFMYGHDNVSTLTLAEMIDLMYAATEYMVEGLNERLIPDIIEKLRVENVYLCLKQPACFQHSRVKITIAEIIQENTEALLSNKGFFDLDYFGLECILEQEALEVNEIQLWRAVLQWARHNLPSFNARNRNKRMKSDVEVKLHANVPSEIADNDEELQSLRDLLSRALKYIRFCTMPGKDFTKEVVTTGILTEFEVYMIARSYGSKIKEPSLTTVCNEIEPRRLTVKKSCGAPS